MTQTEFAFRKPTVPDSRDMENALESFTTQQHPWITAKELRGLTGWTDRAMREMAEHSNGNIISGQNGYCLFRHASGEERHHAGAWMISQGRKMVKRGIRIMRKCYEVEAVYASAQKSFLPLSK